MEHAEERFLKDFGKRVGALSAQKRVSIEHLAYEAGISKGYLYDIVKGKGNPSLLILHRLAAALEAQPWQLLKL